MFTPLLSILFAVVPAVFVVILVIFLARGSGPPPQHKVQQPGWEGTAPGSGQLPPGTGRWNAQVVGAGLIGALKSTYGRFDVHDGWLSFTPNGAPAPAWQALCRDLTVTPPSLFMGAGITLSGPMGVVRCLVSVEHINRFSRNSAKTMREARHAAAFVQVLRANGARG